MNWADYIIIGIIALSVIISLWRGLFKEVLGLTVWGVAAWLAFKYSNQAQALFENSITVPSARMAVGFGLVFIAALIGGGMISFLLGKLIKSTGLSGTDRFLGMFFGVARAGVLMIVLVMAAGFTPLPKDPWWQQSALLPHFESLADWASQFLPPNMQQYFLADDELLPVGGQDARQDSGEQVEPRAAQGVDPELNNAIEPSAEASLDPAPEDDNLPPEDG